jgi:hypothetical protein
LFVCLFFSGQERRAQKIVLWAKTCFLISLACSSIKIPKFRIDFVGATVFSAAYIVSVVHEAFVVVLLLFLGIKNKTNSGASFRQRTIPTERPPLVGEVSANLGI